MEELGRVDKVDPSFVAEDDGFVVLVCGFDVLARGVAQRIESVDQRIGFVLDERTSQSRSLFPRRVRLRDISCVIVERPQVADGNLPPRATEETNEARPFAGFRDDRQRTKQIGDKRVAQNSGDTE